MKEIVMWAVYRHPLDYPDEYVARKHIIDADGNTAPCEDHMRARSLNDIRKALRGLHPGLIRVDRFPDDEPQIVETWL